MKTLKIKRFLRSGDLSEPESIKDNHDLLETFSDVLDAIQTQDVLGEIIFEATDGKTYVMLLEPSFHEISPDYLAQIQDEDAELDSAED